MDDDYVVYSTDSEEHYNNLHPHTYQELDLNYEDFDYAYSYEDEEYR